MSPYVHTMGYADTPGNGPTQSRFILFAQSLKIFIITFYY